MSEKAHYLGQLNWYNLNIACETVSRAFDSIPYLVGSALARADYRDVDIRVILDDAEFARLFPLQPPDPIGENDDHFWAFTCNCISEWLRCWTGLPVDFQVQQRTAADATFGGRRNACGMFLERPAHRPDPGPSRGFGGMA